MYYFYTEENVYIFNAKDGSYAKRIHEIMFFNVIIQ